ncbi:dipeptidyl peptidase 3 [Zootermopsis nevadensis]|uniref:Dipeptidyl peptidase 3 n=1 Tax=Zootermopsis nevadensis TaxID=136037 RepID=A0A067QWV6_ZOONE|nr:dipeptidyl peptidase 3 [Zootermopsis nevadensis]KDR10566.1 Dipeptidyl-peptidase 3 [Zootermopsis nevadensis]
MSDSEHFVLPNDQPVVELDCVEAFKGLTAKEKLYAHYLSQASWNGGLIVLVQTSPESPLVFVLLRKLFSAQPISELKKSLLQDQVVTVDEFQALLVYTSGIFTNSGNYKHFGDTKFVPNLPSSKFEAVIKCSKAYHREPKVMQSLWDQCKEAIYLLQEGVKSLGFRDKGITTYFSSNCTMEDANLVAQLLKHRNMEAHNSRVFKTVENGTPTYEIRLASVETGHDSDVTQDDIDYMRCKFRITRGDYSKLLERVVQNLAKAKDYAANDIEKRMLEHYVHSFTRGTLQDHKDGSRLWVKDKGPVVETYIGFIETYRDPAGMRGEFEGFVAFVNKEMSTKFAILVQQAEVLLTELPWPKGFEKDKFLRPDFTSLEVLTFAGSGIPAGINIPNYTEICQYEGFKNVSLGNVIPASCKQTVMPFLSEEDKVLLMKYRVQAFEVQVGLHELLGHGSGKMLCKHKDGQYNFDHVTLVNPLDGELIKSWYEDGDTYDSKFTTMGSSYEECRAECVGLFLSLNKDVLRIFGFEGREAEDVAYVNWLNLLYQGVGRCLEMYQPSTNTWLQAHSQARYVILRVLLEAGGDLVTVTETVKGKDLLMKVDRSKIASVGKMAISNFLLKLQVYKSTGDIAAAQALYNKYAEVPDDGSYPWGKWRDIVLAHRQPRKMFVQGNTILGQGNEVTLKTYEATHEGLIQSWIDRFQLSDIDIILEEMWEKDQKHF